MYVEYDRCDFRLFQVRDFLHLLIKVHKCDAEMIKTLAFRLGARHKGYMNEGNDNSYWAPFAQQLPIFIAKTYMDVVDHDNRIRRIFRVRVHADRSEEEELVDSWRQLMNSIVEAMKRGYEGCASQKTPMRLSITNSIISMASLRSGRSRSASHFLEPTMSPVLGKCFRCSVISFAPYDISLGCFYSREIGKLPLFELNTFVAFCGKSFKMHLLHKKPAATSQPT
ncbi:unnamed protein product [Heligmosomoides polygyrus]|uniref:GLOBIN domain-containing protein n=1 Tax=Heligmosomoides polygyrus TaxID=6339 RepID=A0A3P8AXU5_HELPZ|nr:unnamed protein product [Heligmosomoides polygyrus]